MNPALLKTPGRITIGSDYLYAPLTIEANDKIPAGKTVQILSLIFDNVVDKDKSVYEVQYEGESYSVFRSCLRR